MIELILLTALSIFGLHNVVDSIVYTKTQESLSDIYTRHAPPTGVHPLWWAKPLIFCPICMSSFWGFPTYILWAYLLPIDPILAGQAIIPAIFAVAGLLTLSTRI